MNLHDCGTSLASFHPVDLERFFVLDTPIKKDKTLVDLGLNINVNYQVTAMLDQDQAVFAPRVRAPVMVSANWSYDIAIGYLAIR